MSKFLKPLCSLTVAEYIDLIRETFSTEVEKIIQKQENESETEKEGSDIIFMDEVMNLTGYRKATLYSKVSRYEIPVLSRRKPLTFSRKALINWINVGKPNVIEQEAEDYFDSKPKCR